MATTTDSLLVDQKVIDHLNDMIQLDYDASLTYQQAIAHVEDILVKTDLESFLRDHERHIMELTQLIRDLGGEPKHIHRDAKGLVLEGMTKIRSMTGTGGALRAMRMNEKLTNRTYEKAVESDLPLIARELLAQNLMDERRHLMMIEQHLERLSTLSGDEHQTAGDEHVRDDHPDLQPGARL